MVRLFLLIVAIIAAVIGIIFAALYTSDVVAHAKDLGIAVLFALVSLGFFEFAAAVPADARVP